MHSVVCLVVLHGIFFLTTSSYSIYITPNRSSWNESFTLCTMVGLNKTVSLNDDPSTDFDQLTALGLPEKSVAWIGSRPRFSRWLSFDGCYKSKDASNEGSYSIPPDKDAELYCYKKCPIGSFAITNSRCYCRLSRSIYHCTPKQNYSRRVGVSGYPKSSVSDFTSYEVCACAYNYTDDVPSDIDSENNCMFPWNESSQKFQSDNCTNVHDYICRCLAITLFQVKGTWKDAISKCAQCNGQLFAGTDIWYRYFRMKTVEWVKPSSINADCVALHVSTNGSLKYTIKPCRTSLPAICYNSTAETQTFFLSTSESSKSTDSIQTSTNSYEIAGVTTTNKIQKPSAPKPTLNLPIENISPKTSNMYIQTSDSSKLTDLNHHHSDMFDTSVKPTHNSLKDNQTETRTDSTLYIIIGVVVGCVFIVSLVIIVICIRRKKRMPPSSNGKNNKDIANGSPSNKFQNVTYDDMCLEVNGTTTKDTRIDYGTEQISAIGHINEAKSPKVMKNNVTTVTVDDTDDYDHLNKFKPSSDSDLYDHAPVTNGDYGVLQKPGRLTKADEVSDYDVTPAPSSHGEGLYDHLNSGHRDDKRTEESDYDVSGNL